MSGSGRPGGDGGGRPPSDDELRALLRTGQRELADVDDAQLSRRWRAVDDLLDRDETSTTTAGSPRSAPAGDGGAGIAAPPPPARLWRDRVPMAAVAALALVVGVGAGMLVDDATDEPQGPTPLATYELGQVGGTDAGTTPTATLTEQDGARTVEVDLDGLPDTDGFHEVWLLDPDTGALASLGPVRPDGRYVVPDGTDLATLTVLDVSSEPLDGDPTHSGDSLLRGEVIWTG